MVRALPRIENSNENMAHSQRTEGVGEIYSGTVLGRTENIQLLSGDTLLKAKLDPKLAQTVMDVVILKTFEQNGKEFITYSVTSEKNDTKEFTKAVKFWKNVNSSTGKEKRRPVVTVELCLGNKRIRGDVSLANKVHFLYPIVIGSNMLKNTVIVDASKEYTTEPSCN